MKAWRRSDQRSEAFGEIEDELATADVGGAGGVAVGLVGNGRLHVEQVVDGKAHGDAVKPTGSGGAVETVGEAGVVQLGGKSLA